MPPAYRAAAKTYKPRGLASNLAILVRSSVIFLPVARVFFGKSEDTHQPTVNLDFKMKDARLIVGTVLIAKTIHATSDAEARRRFGAAAKKKWVEGVMTDVISTRSATTNRVTRKVAVENNLGGDYRKSAVLQLKRVWLPGQEGVNSGTASTATSARTPAVAHTTPNGCENGNGNVAGFMTAGTIATVANGSNISLQSENVVFGSAQTNSVVLGTNSAVSTRNVPFFPLQQQ
jgi:hypothetical protein